MTKKYKFKNELKRKALHLILTAFISTYFIISQDYTKENSLLFLKMFLVGFLIIEFLRIQHKWKFKILDETERKKERRNLRGGVFFLISAIIVLSIHKSEIALAAILMTVIGDLTAAIVGTYLGKNRISKNNDKTWEGSSAELAANLIIGISLAGPVIGTIMALTATAAETFITAIDDNLSVPIFAGFVGEIVRIAIKTQSL